MRNFDRNIKSVTASDICVWRRVGDGTIFMMRRRISKTRLIREFRWRIVVKNVEILSHVHLGSGIEFVSVFQDRWSSYSRLLDLVLDFPHNLWQFLSIIVQPKMITSADSGVDWKNARWSQTKEVKESSLEGVDETRKIYAEAQFEVSM